MITINGIEPMPLDKFDVYKKYTKAKNVDCYWVYTEDENDLWTSGATEQERLNDPQMLMSYEDGELCEGSVTDNGNVIPILHLNVINDPVASTFLSDIGNVVKFADITWTVCARNTLIANESIGKTIYNTKEKYIKYEDSVLEKFLNSWLDQHRNDKIIFT